MTLKESFEKAAKESKELPEKPDNETLLKLYSLYKQATEGDVKAIIAALGNAASVPALDTIAAGSKSKTWKPDQRRKMQEAYVARKAQLSDPDYRETAGAA